MGLKQGQTWGRGRGDEARALGGRTALGSAGSCFQGQGWGGRTPFGWPWVSPYTLVPPEGADHTRAIILGCIGGIVAVGLGLVLAYRLSVEIYDRREYSRFEKERQQLNWKEVRPATAATGWAFLAGLSWWGLLLFLLR